MAFRYTHREPVEQLKQRRRCRDPGCSGCRFSGPGYHGRWWTGLVACARPCPRCGVGHTRHPLSHGHFRSADRDLYPFRDCDDHKPWNRDNSSADNDVNGIEHKRSAGEHVFIGVEHLYDVNDDDKTARNSDDESFVTHDDDHETADYHNNDKASAHDDDHETADYHNNDKASAHDDDYKTADYHHDSLYFDCLPVTLVLCKRAR